MKKFDFLCGYMNVCIVFIITTEMGICPVASFDKKNKNLQTSLK